MVRSEPARLRQTGALNDRVSCLTGGKMTRDQQLEIYYWMLLTRVFDENMVALWKQGRGVGGTFSQRGHEAISVGAGMALAPDDVVAPMHRDLGTYLLRGLTPRRIFRQSPCPRHRRYARSRRQPPRHRRSQL